MGDKEKITRHFNKIKCSVSEALTDKHSMFFRLHSPVHRLSALIAGSIFPWMIICHGALDHETTQHTKRIVGNFNDELIRLEKEPNIKSPAHKEFIDNILSEENISERQAYILLRRAENSFGELHEITGYNIGSIDDLREARGELGESAQPEHIADATVQAERVENILSGAYILSFAIFMICVGGGLISKSERVQNCALNARTLRDQKRTNVSTVMLD